MGAGDRVQTLERRIGAAVVHEAHAPVDAGGTDLARELVVKAIDDRRFVAAGHDDREALSHGVDLAGAGTTWNR